MRDTLFTVAVKQNASQECCTASIAKFGLEGYGDTASDALRSLADLLDEHFDEMEEE